MASAHRTNAIAEAAIRATGDKLYQAASRAEEEGESVKKAQRLFRKILASVITQPSDDELAV